MRGARDGIAPCGLGALAKGRLACLRRGRCHGMAAAILLWAMLLGVVGSHALADAAEPTSNSSRAARALRVAVDEDGWSAAHEATARKGERACVRSKALRSHEAYAESRWSSGGPAAPGAEDTARDLLLELLVACGPTDPAVMRWHFRLGEVYRRSRQWVPALAQYQLAIDLADGAAGANVDGAWVGLVHYRCAMILSARADAKSALSAVDAAIALLRPPTSRLVDVADAYRLRARLHRRLNDSDAALADLDASVAVAELAASPQLADRIRASALNDASFVYRDRGRIHDVIRLRQEVVAVRERAFERDGGEDPEAITRLLIALINLATVYDADLRFDDALAGYQTALRLSEDRFGADSAEVGDVLNNLGGHYEQRNDLRMALDAYQRALTLRRDGRGADDPRTLTAAHNAGRLLLQAGEGAAALKLLTQALEGRERRRTQEPGHWRSSLLVVGAAWARLGNRDKAEPLLRQAIAHSKGWERAVAHRRLASILSTFGDSEGARRERSLALALLEEIEAPAQEIAALRLAELGAADAGAADVADLEVALQDVEAANDPWSVAVIGARSTVALRHPDVAVARDLVDQALLPVFAPERDQARFEVLGTARQVAERAGRPHEAIFWEKQRVELIASWRRDLVDGEADARTFHRVHQGYFDRLRAMLVAAGRFSEAERVRQWSAPSWRPGQDAVSAGEGGSLLTAAERRWQDGVLALHERVRDAAQRRLLLRAQLRRRAEEEREEVRRRWQAADAEVSEAEREMGLLLTTLRRDLDRVARRPPSPSPVRIPPGAGLLDVILLPEELVLTVATAGRRRVHRVPVDRSAFRARVGGLLTALSSPQADPLPAARDLYTLLLAPVEGDLLGADTLWWRPSDVLSFVPLSALHDGERYVAERWAVLRVRDDLPPQPASSRVGLVAIGAGTGSATRPDLFPSLPHVAAEVEAVAATEPGARVLVDDGLTVDALRAVLAEPPRTLHLAAHFHYVPGDANASALHLGGERHLSLADLRASLGDFRGVELVTLSACRTGVSELGLPWDADPHGLADAFFTAGARQVLASLWPLDDAGAAEWMTAFYGSVRSGATAVEALRRAQTAMLRGEGPGLATGSAARGLTLESERAEQRTHPYYWAGVVFVAARE